MSRRYERLYVEYERLKFLFANHDRIRIEEAVGDPPDHYVIEYRVLGLVETKEGVGESSLHRVQITLGQDYPKVAPYCVMLTPAFHPNIDGFKICTEDVTPANRRLDQIIVFIGRLITFQTFNLTSTRNGEARVWTEQHLSRFPLDKVELLPRWLQEGKHLPTFTAQDIPAPKARPLPEPQPRCANCGGSAGKLDQCSGAHLVCADCSVTCSNCSRLLCALCEMHACADCRSQVCPECWIVCSQCGRELCPAHVRFCATCNTPRCRACLSVCPNCGRLSCTTHLDSYRRCSRCGGTGQARPDTTGVAPDLPAPSPAPAQAPAVAQPHIPECRALVETPVRAPLSAPVPLLAAEEVSRITPRFSISAAEAMAVPEAALIRPDPLIELGVPQSPPRSGKALASLIFGVVGAPVLGILVGWFAVWFGAMALRDIKRSERLLGRKLAISGVVLGICDIILWVVLLAAFGPSIFAPRFGPLNEPPPQPANHSASLAPVRV